MRVPISLPCSVPVVPGTGDAGAPIEERTERCAIDAFWIAGRAPICSLHLAGVIGREHFDELCAEAMPFGLNDRESIALLDWSRAYRYDQASADPRWGPALNEAEAARRG